MSEDRFAAVREWLNNLHGCDVSRACLDRGEAQALTLNQAYGRLVVADLDISGYGGRWAQAVENSIARRLDPSKLEFWLKARKYFLELGGCYKFGWSPAIEHITT